MKQDIFNQYVERIISRFGIKREDLFLKSKRRDLVDARHLLYYLCVKRPMRINYIQRYMAENGYEVKHPTIIHGVNIVIDKLSHDDDYVSLIRELDSSNQYSNLISVSTT